MFSPEDLATQITLLDHPVFCNIMPDELTSCSWTKKNKETVAPNVVAFIRRFNYISFWTVQGVNSSVLWGIKTSFLSNCVWFK